MDGSRWVLTLLGFRIAFQKITKIVEYFFTPTAIIVSLNFLSSFRYHIPGDDQVSSRDVARAARALQKVAEDR